MSRRKKKKTTVKKKNGFAFAGRLILQGGGLILKTLPALLIFGAAGGLFVGVRGALYADPRMNISEVVVDPAAALSRGRMQDLETRLMGKNILQIDLDRVALELQTNPSIRSARVSRQLPSSLRVDIETRTAAAFIQFSPKGSVGLISEDGMVLDMAPAPNASLPLVEAYGLGYKQPEIGMQVKSRGFSETMQFLKQYWKHPMSKRETLSRLSLDPAGHLTLTLSGGPDIRLGRQPSHRMQTLVKIMHLLEGPERTEIEYVDLQYDNIIVKRKKT